MTSSDPTPVIRTENLYRTFVNGDVHAVEDVSLSVNSGEWLAIMGSSGSGKSTLLQLMGTLDKPDQGKVLFEGVDSRSIKRLDRFRASNIGFVFQMHYLLPHLSLLDNVAIPLAAVPGVSASEGRERAAEMLDHVGLGHRVKHLPNKVSGGEKQRAAIARAIVNNPGIVLADEPTGNVDSRTETRILDLFQQIREESGATFVIVTHDAEVARRADRVVEMRDGRLLTTPELAGKENTPLSPMIEES